MVALNETLVDVVDQEVFEIAPAPLARAAFVDETALFETTDLPAGNRREQLIIQIRLMNPGATREMLVGFSEGALQAYVDHLKLAMTPRELIRGRGRGVRMSGVPGIVRHVPDSE